ncbi:MAG: hypothetical protein ACD_79C01302G0015 [uncultured bacterium]|nr:MAG: hypothetical protein ACD_79C01302G0015 [uncultured bacterium]
MINKKNLIKMYNLPEEIKFCKKCTISNQRPRITFDGKGICSACNFAEFKKEKINWIDREEELKELCKRFKRKDGGFEVIVPSSGGKDSSTVAHNLKYKYGMNVLTVTWAPNVYTDIGWKNYINAINVGGFHNLMWSADGKINRKLVRLSFEILGDPFQPFIYGVTNFAMKIAVKLKIPLLMYGENGEVEYGGDMKNAFKPTRDYKKDHAKHYFSGLPPEELVNYGISKNDIYPYMSPSIDELDENKTEIHFWSYYKKWIPQENFYYCAENTGYSANPERTEGTYSKYASIDDKIDGFHFYLAYIKFGIGRATQDSAHEIRDGHLTREEGVQLVKKYDGEFPKKYFKEFQDYCGISEEYFWEVIDSWRSDHIWRKENGLWKIKHRVSNDGADD